MMMVEVGVEFNGRMDWHLREVRPRAGWDQIVRQVLADYRPGACCDRPDRIVIRAPWLVPTAQEYVLRGKRYQRV